MLVLKRKIGKRIIITDKTNGTTIVITAVNVGGDSMKIGVDAPQHVVIDREEVHLAKLAERGV